jgi:hypothetical protein
MARAVLQIRQTGLRSLGKTLSRVENNARPGHVGIPGLKAGRFAVIGSLFDCGGTSKNSGSQRHPAIQTHWLVRPGLSPNPRESRFFQVPCGITPVYALNSVCSRAPG